MKKNICIILFVTFLMLGISLIAWSQVTSQKKPVRIEPSTSISEKRTWNLKDVDIHTLINEVAKETKKNFVIDPKVKGKVTIISNYPLSADEFYQAFLAVLAVNGFTAVPSGPVVKIIPETFEREENAEVMNNVSQLSEEMGVAVVRVKYVSATELARALRQLIHRFGYLDVYAPANDVIIADRTNNMSKLIELIHRIDQPTASKVEIIHIKHARASDLVTTITSLLQQKTGAASANISLAAEERSNDILIHGATPELRLQLRALLSQLDIPLDTKGLVIDVIYLKYLRAERVAVILSGLIDNYFREKAEQKKPGTGPPPSTFSFTPPSASFSQPSQPASPSFSTAYGQSMTGMGTGMGGGAGGGQFGKQNPNTEFSNITQHEPKSGSAGPYVQWEESTNSVVVSAPPDLIRKLKGVIEKLDIRRPQVLIEAVIAEVSIDHKKELGIEINVGDGFRLLTRFDTILPLSHIGNNNKLATAIRADSVGAGLSAAIAHKDVIRFLIRALQNDTESNVLATPNILTLDNEPAQIKVGSIISFATSQITNTPTGGNPQSFFNREDVGLILTINPQITPNGSIRLVLQEELSSLIPGTSGAGGNPDTSERFIRTTVMANNGEVLVLGGLLRSDWQNVTSKVPLLGDIPGVGNFFKNNEKSLKKTNLMIFLRPTILYEDKDKVHIIGGKYEYLRQHQLQTDKERTSDEFVPPAIPPWPGQVALPPPFGYMSKQS